MTWSGGRGRGIRVVVDHFNLTFGRLNAIRRALISETQATTAPVEKGIEWKPNIKPLSNVTDGGSMYYP